MIEHHELEPVLSLPEPPKGWRGVIQRLFHPLATWILRMEKINRIEMRMTDRVVNGDADTGQAYVEDFDLTIDCSEEQVEHIPFGHARLDGRDRRLTIEQVGDQDVTPNFSLHCAKSVAV